MDQALAPSWRKKVFMLFWHNVHAHCPVCLEEAELRMRVARLVDGRELRDLACQVCRTRLPAVQRVLSEQELREERAIVGDQAMHRCLPHMAREMLTMQQKLLLEARAEAAVRRLSNTQPTTEESDVHEPRATGRAVSTRPNLCGEIKRQDAKFYPRIVRGPTQHRGWLAWLRHVVSRAFGR